MTILKIETEAAPKALGPYSQALRFENLLFVSGQLPILPKTGLLVESDIEQQTRQVLYNIQAILEAAGSNLNRVLRADIFLKNLNDFKAVNAVYAEFFSGPIQPARQTVEVARLPLDALIEISCIAALIL